MFFACLTHWTIDRQKCCAAPFYGRHSSGGELLKKVRAEANIQIIAVFVEKERKCSLSHKKYINHTAKTDVKTTPKTSKPCPHQKLPAHRLTYTGTQSREELRQDRKNKHLHDGGEVPISQLFHYAEVFDGYFWRLARSSALLPPPSTANPTNAARRGPPTVALSVSGLSTISQTGIDSATWPCGDPPFGCLISKSLFCRCCVWRKGSSGGLFVLVVFGLF